jgi:hypothetical protein
MSEYPREQITPLLTDIVRDNPTYPFPLPLIEKELYSLLVNQEEYEYFMMVCYRRLKKEVGVVIGNIFLTTLEMILDTQNKDPHTLSNEDYISKIDEVISTLEGMNITIIDKKSPDGILMSAMA